MIPHSGMTTATSGHIAMTVPSATAGNDADGRTSTFWRRLVEKFRPSPISTPAAFSRFLEERASLIAQKCAVDYCRGKTGLASYALFTEAPFLKAYDICRWEAFSAVLGDLFIVAEGYLRPHVPPEARSRACQIYIDMYSSVLKAMGTPAHRPHGWDDAVATFTLRMQAVSAGEPLQALDVADHSAKQLYDTLPIHMIYRELDEEVVYGSVRFRMIAVSQEMRRRVVAANLAQALLDGR